MSQSVAVLAITTFASAGQVYWPGAVARLTPDAAREVLETGRAQLIDPPEARRMQRAAVQVARLIHPRGPWRPL